MKKKILVFFLSAIFACSNLAGASDAGSEVLKESSAKVVVREHPRTGNPYVVVTREGLEARDPFQGIKKKYARPDYRMLDPKVKSGKIPYDGPYSSRKKVYALAASLAAVGVVGGTAIIATAPAATGAGAAGGAGAYGAAGGAVAAGSISAGLSTTRDPKEDNRVSTSESRRT